jgi:2-dehydro-3-deoxygluconokinase
MPDMGTFGEAMIRLSPPHFQRLDQTAALHFQVGGGELNVPEGEARLGLTSPRVSRLPQNFQGHPVENRARQAGADTSPLLPMPTAHSTMM